MRSKYRDAGVNIDAGNRAVDLMKSAIQATFTPAVLGEIGGFGGLFALDNLPPNPVLVASTDGVGTKVKLAAHLKHWGGIGHDIVNHCINDILVQGAKPLFFLDYIAARKLVPEQIAAIVIGMAEACAAADCVLLGGETAEMPGVYTRGSFDVAGTIVGIVNRDDLLPKRDKIEAGDIIFGLPSSGPHTNGYALIRKVVEDQDLAAPFDDSGIPLGEALLAPHRSYLPEINTLQAAEIPIKGMVHITGGGFFENIPRILPARLGAEIMLQTWTIPPLFQSLMRWAGMSRKEAFRVLNMGIGMIVIIEEAHAQKANELIPAGIIMGQVAPSRRPVQLVERGL